MSSAWLINSWRRVLLPSCASLCLIFFRTLALDLHKHPDSSVASLIDRLKVALADDNSSLEADLAEARAQLERVVRHSHQVQESLEQLLQLDQAKQRQIEELQQELNKAMAELEYFYVQSRVQSDMLVEHEKLQKQATDLLASTLF